MKTIRSIAFAAVTLAACLLPTACSNTGVPSSAVTSAVTVGTSLAVNVYPAAAPFVEMFAGAVRSYTAKGPIAPDALAAAFTPYVNAAENLVGKVSAKGKADIAKYAAAILAKYTADYPALQKGEISVEAFAQAVEAGA